MYGRLKPTLFNQPNMVLYRVQNKHEVFIVAEASHCELGLGFGLPKLAEPLSCMVGNQQKPVFKTKRTMAKGYLQ